MSKDVNKEDLLNKLQNVYNDFYGCRNEMLKPETDLTKDLQLDSIDQLEFVMMIEDNFDISITNEEVQQIKIVKDILNLMETKLFLKDPE